MANAYVDLSQEDQKALLANAAIQLGKREAVLEKDIWVCWVLQVLFSIPNAHPMAFKGGTSLSKVYGVIDRFSEDVDITLDYRGFGEEFDPFKTGQSRNQIRKFSERLKDHVKRYGRSVVILHIGHKLKELPNAEQFGIEIEESGEKIWLNYPSVVEGDDYMKSQVLIELGGRNVIDPNERHHVSPDIAALFENIHFPTCEVVVLSPERTFWEKATLIHVECHRKALKANPQRLSRHWYDLYKLSQQACGQSAIKNRELLEDVVRHKSVFFHTSYANYDACLEFQFALVPADGALTGLREDYKEMIRSGMMHGDEIPEFDQVITVISKLEKQINEASAG